MGGCTSAELAAAVSNQGGLGGIGSLFRTTAAIKRDIEAVKGLTNRHYAINHIPQMLDAEAVPPEWPCVCTAYRSVSR
jgi:NAD(P)H-dependent flavin oxidoreductase YrpB (nitropropane dioxygenase family)